MNSTKWIVLSDFDGTLTTKDVGNELCKRFIPQLFDRVNEQYFLGNLNLRAEQKILWEDFPANKELFQKTAQEVGVFRKGVNEFLEKCLLHKIPVFVASCGMDAYIEAVLEKQASPTARQAIHAIECNRTEFSGERLIKIHTPVKDEKSAYPLHKGEWAGELKKKFPGTKILGIGDGSSDFSMLGYVDKIYATRKLADKCVEKNVAFERFEDFSGLINCEIFQ
ncbi:MAG: HAD-IB family phosphatase [Proteobacteria bacterium]|nr:HAD-IB family phosphatase [Pseudomonadota bacterium]